MIRNLVICAAAGLSTPAAAGVPDVAADIAPVHALVQRVMMGAGSAKLIIPPGASPHDHAMRPSVARALQSADVVVWMGEGLAPWMEKPLAALSPEAVLLELPDVAGTVQYMYRDPGHADHDDHDDHDASHEDHDEGGDEGDGRAPHGHTHEGVDPHAWLDPENARLWVHEIAEVLAKADPQNAETYRMNARAADSELAALEAEIERDLSDGGGIRFISFHDAYQYFEKRFGLTSAGAVSLGDATAPGPARLSELKARIRETGIDCAFVEPQFDTRLIEAAVEGTDAKIVEMDPIGVTLTPGADLYPDLLRQMAASYLACASAE